MTLSSYEIPAFSLKGNSVQRTLCWGTEDQRIIYLLIWQDSRVSSLSPLNVTTLWREQKRLCDFFIGNSEVCTECCKYQGLKEERKKRANVGGEEGGSSALPNPRISNFFSFSFSSFLNGVFSSPPWMGTIDRSTGHAFSTMFLPLYFTALFSSYSPPSIPFFISVASCSFFRIWAP